MPARRKVFTMPSPIPLAPPVTKATLSTTVCIGLCPGACQVSDDGIQLGVADFSLAEMRHDRESVSDHGPNELRAEIAALLEHCRKGALVFGRHRAFSWPLRHRAVAS